MLYTVFCFLFKKTHGEEKSSVVKQAYAALSDKERVKLIYRIIQSVEVRTDLLALLIT